MTTSGSATTAFAGTTDSPARATTAVPVLRRQLGEGRRGLLGWSAGLAAIILLYLPVYPSLRTPELREMIDTMPVGVSDTLGFDQIATGAGYAQATYFGLIGFLLVVAAATTWGSYSIAGAEESGRLELTMAHAVGRVQYVAETVVALVVRIVLLAVVSVVLILALNGPAQLSLSAGHLVTVTVAWAGLGLLSGACALAVGALTGRRAWSVGAGVGIAVLGYGLNAVGESSSTLEWMLVASPYHWAFGESPLATGNGRGGIALVWALCAVLIALGCWAFSRRDLRG
ncbi:ABC transporter permease [Actinomyces sp. 2119]|uniref:ABC transporter permease subunit n=1 Tax=Actinomyces sp. 2119 TaxID=2321393 RepID=UPI000E6C7D91|nr:ABC transporter permease subunit [Actinomyces sp. 2119]RJF43937.1 ABC transporter permease [Actinomyces sp. 2119]